MSIDLAGRAATAVPVAPVRARTRHRRVAVGLGVGVLAVALVVAGWFAALRFESPAQRAAAATAPPALPVTAAVSHGTLAQQITATTTVEHAGQSPVALIPAGTGTSVVTAQLVTVGTAVDAGTAVLTVNGRPEFVLPGETGPDVVQLQDALRAAGLYTPARSDGLLGAQTVAAVRRLYLNAGFAVPTEITTPTQATVPIMAAPGDAATDNGTAATPPAPTPVVTLVVPAAELLFVAQVPAVVVGLPPVGTVVDGTTTVTLATSSLVARADIAASVQNLLTTATTGVLTDAAGTAIEVHVSAVTPGDATTGVAASVQMSPISGTFPDAWAGQKVLATLNLSVVADDSLLVPSRAVAQDAAGATHVLVRQPDGSFRAVAITERGNLSGQSAVVPVDPDALHAGDQVQVS